MILSLKCSIVKLRMSSKTSLLGLVKRINNFYFGDFLNNSCIPFKCCGSQVGLLSKNVVGELSHYPDVFIITPDSVDLSPQLRSAQERSKALELVLLDMRSKDTFLALRGWRGECYEIRQQFSQPPLFKMERSATPIFGVRQYGVHINGYVRHSASKMSLWMQRRAATKQTWPGKLGKLSHLDGVATVVVTAQ